MSPKPPDDYRDFTQYVLTVARLLGYLPISWSRRGIRRDQLLQSWISARREYCAEKKLPLIVAFVGERYASILIEAWPTSGQINEIDALMAPSRNRPRWYDSRQGSRRYTIVAPERVHELASGVLRIMCGAGK